MFIYCSWWNLNTTVTEDWIKGNYILKQSATSHSCLMSILTVPSNITKYCKMKSPRCAYTRLCLHKSISNIITMKYRDKNTFANTGKNSLADSKHISSNVSITSICRIFLKICYKKLLSIQFLKQCHLFLMWNLNIL